MAAGNLREGFIICTGSNQRGLVCIRQVNFTVLITLFERWIGAGLWINAAQIGEGLKRDRKYVRHYILFQTIDLRPNF